MDAGDYAGARRSAQRVLENGSDEEKARAQVAVGAMAPEPGALTVWAILMVVVLLAFGLGIVWRNRALEQVPADAHQLHKALVSPDVPAAKEGTHGAP
jgi:hypothetical protein